MEMGFGMLHKIRYVLDHEQKRKIIWLWFAMIIAGFLEMLGVSSILPVISALVNPEAIEQNQIYNLLCNYLYIGSFRGFVAVAILGLILIYVVKNTFLLLLYRSQYRYIYYNQRIISNKLMQCYMAQDYIFHTTHNVAELQRNVSTDVSGFFTVILHFMELFTEGITCFFLVVFLLVQDVQTTLFLMVILCVFMLLLLKVYRRRMAIWGERNRECAALLNKWILQSFGGIKEVKVNSIERYFLNHYDKTYMRYAGIQAKQLLYNVAPRPVMETLCICGLLGFLGIRIYTGESPTNFVAVMSVFAAAAIRMLPSFSRISNAISVIMYNKPSLEAVYSDLKSIESLKKNLSAENDDTKEVRFNREIVVDKVSFSYPSNPDKIILNKVTLEIPFNKSVALIGASGGGKTTLADLILGILAPTSGDIQLDGEYSIFDNLRGWHKTVGYIPQTIYLTDDTIRANVAFGIDPDQIDDERVRNSLRDAQLLDYIESQKDGIYTQIGDRGVKLSGGQRQRIGIARALYRQPSLLVLDEATSALDNETEAAVMESIDSLAGSLTIIIIAHRLSTIQNCDIVYEVKDGNVLRKK